jgi:hypothetical protein
VQTPTPKRPKYTGHLSGFLEAHTQAEELRAHWLRFIGLKRQPKPALLDALSAGRWALEQRAAKSAELLRDRGQLLFAHASTTYFKHRPHVGAVEAWALQPVTTTQSEEVAA